MGNYSLLLTFMLGISGNIEPILHGATAFVSAGTTLRSVAYYMDADKPNPIDNRGLAQMACYRGHTRLSFQTLVVPALQ